MPAGRVIGPPPTIARGWLRARRAARRRRPRPGSLERPVNARMYRGTWLLVGLPLLVAAFSVARPAPLPRPALPPTFDARRALVLAGELARDTRPLARLARRAERPTGSPNGSAPTASARSGTLRREIPGLGRVRLKNLIATDPGDSTDTIVVMAHRDDTGWARARTTTPPAPPR